MSLATEQQRLVFLAKNNLADATHKFLAGDWSPRKYYRVTKPDGQTLVLLTAPTDMLETRNIRWDAFIEAQRLMKQLGASVPEIYAADKSTGLMLMEDFGDDSFERLIEATTQPAPYYHRGVEWSIDMLGRTLGKADLFSKLPTCDVEWWLEEVDNSFHNTYLPSLLRRELTVSERTDLDAAWRSILADALNVPFGFMHRDYQSSNIIELAERTGFQSCGIIDIQNAAYGPMTYDLVAITEQIRRDLDLGIVAELKKKFLAAFPQLTLQQFNTSYDVLSLHQHLRVLGGIIIAHHAAGVNKFAFMPRMGRHIESLLQNPQLASFKTVLDKIIPPNQRRYDLTAIDLAAA